MLVALFLAVLFMQNDAGQDAASIGAAMESVLGIDSDSDPSFETTSDITDWLNATVETIFTTPTCGDFTCSYPEEYPSYNPGSAYRQDFQPCESDCGYLGGVNISMRVTFSDIMKLRAAYADFDALASASSYAAHTRDEWGISDLSPIGGWNICSRDKTEYGYLENVCLFDGDVFIDGLPYRTDELDRDSSQYGGTSPTIALFEGNWEMRIAFANFTLTSNYDVAYPAVGGYFQFEVENCGDDDGSACSWNTGVEYFSPCPNAAECSSQFVRGEYYSDCAVGGVGSSSTPCVDQYGTRERRGWHAPCAHARAARVCAARKP